MAKSVTHTGPHGTVNVTVEPKVHTSDGEPRNNTVQPLTPVTLAPIPIRIGDNARVSVLYTLAANLNLILTNKAKPNIIGIAQNAAYPHSNVTQRINDLINGINSVTPGTLTPYISIDYNAFPSVVQQLSAAMNTINT